MSDRTKRMHILVATMLAFMMTVTLPAAPVVGEGKETGDGKDPYAMTNYLDFKVYNNDTIFGARDLPVAGSPKDDAYWEVTFDFEDWWVDQGFTAYAPSAPGENDTAWRPVNPGSSNREPTLISFKDKLFLFWEGFLVPETTPDPTNKGKLYVRSFTDDDGVTKWGPIVTLTPGAQFADHVNQKIMVIVYNERLYAFWMSKDNNVQLHPDSYPHEVDRWDIFYRVTDDGVNWEKTRIVSRTGTSWREDAGTDGYDSFPSLAIFQDKLYVAWQRKMVSKQYAHILFRSTDGTSWGPIGRMSNDPNYEENRTDNLEPSLTTFNNQLYCTWHRQIDRLSAGPISVVYSRTSDGNQWSQVYKLSKDISVNVFLDTEPKMLAHNGELHAFWRTYKTDANWGGKYDWDVVTTRSTDGLSWQPVIELSEQDKNDDSQITPYVYNGKLYVAWATASFYTGGDDHDIIYKIFDDNTKTWGSYTIASRIDDRDTDIQDDSEHWNSGTDMWPRMTSYANQWDGQKGPERLFMIWWTFDNVTGCCKNLPAEDNITGPATVIVDATDRSPTLDPIYFQNFKAAIEPIESGKYTPVKVTEGPLTGQYLYIAATDLTGVTGTTARIAPKMNTTLVYGSLAGDLTGKAVEIVTATGEVSIGDYLSAKSLEENTPFPSGKFFVHKADVSLLKVRSTIVMKVIEDGDHDGDTHKDHQDVFPKDAEEWKDSDWDGVGDNSDADPYDATVTDIKGTKTDSEGEAGLTPRGLLLLGIIAIVAAAALGLMVGGKKPRSEEPPIEKKGKSKASKEKKGGGGKGAAAVKKAEVDETDDDEEEEEEEEDEEEKDEDEEGK